MTPLKPSLSRRFKHRQGLFSMSAGLSIFSCLFEELCIMRMHELGFENHFMYQILVGIFAYVLLLNEKYKIRGLRASPEDL